MSLSLAEGEVIVTLSCLAPTTLTFPQRRLLLSNQKTTIPIGRASKRSSILESRMYNAWIDAPVMSREHAELKLDSQGQTVFIRDVGSLHGTYHNDTKLRAGQSQALQNGDLLKFGISIDRGAESFPQCTMKVNLEFGQITAKIPVEASLPQPTVFQVPDDSESEDMEELDNQAVLKSMDDDEDPALATSADILEENGLELAEFHGFDTSDPIDLTSEPDLVSEDNIPSSDTPDSDEAGLPSHDADCTLGTVEFDDVELGTRDEDVSIALPSDRFAPATRFHEVDITDGDVPGMNGPLSEDQHLPPLSQTSPSIVRAKTLGELSGKPKYFIAREQNRLHVQGAIMSKKAEIKEALESHENEEAQEAFPSLLDMLAEATPGDANPKKRKADEMSGAHPTEVQTDENGSEVLSQDPVPTNRADQIATPIYKRIRTATEVLGFMAIGGAAVMTALVATAPTF